MTMVPMQKKCPYCGKVYNWNPDVGQGLYCPRCKGMGIAGIIRKKEKKEKRPDILD